MSQIYSPSTVLSVGFGETLEQVVVLTEGKVATKTFAGKPVNRRDIMSLEDWKIMIGSQEIQTDYLPLALTSAMSVPVPMVVAVPVPMAAVEETYTVGTKLSWTQPEGSVGQYFPNSRIAIVLKDGILQVKEQINGVIAFTQHHECGRKRVAQKFFSSLADWKATLPAGGSIASKAGEDYSVPNIKRKALVPVKAETDVDYIKVLQQRFRVCSRLEKGMSLTQRLVQQVASIREEMTLVDSLTSPLVLATTRAPLEISETLEKANFAAKRLRLASTKATGIQRTISWEPCKAHVVPQWFANGYKQRLVAFVKGKEIEICSNPKDGILGLSGDPSLGTPYGHFYGSPKTGKTFAELGIDLKADGKPRLKMYYRNESIEL